MTQTKPNGVHWAQLRFSDLRERRGYAESLRHAAIILEDEGMRREFAHRRIPAALLDPGLVEMKQAFGKWLVGSVSAGVTTKLALAYILQHLNSRDLALPAGSYEKLEFFNAASNWLLTMGAGSAVFRGVFQLFPPVKPECNRILESARLTKPNSPAAIRDNERRLQRLGAQLTEHASWHDAVTDLIEKARAENDKARAERRILSAEAGKRKREALRRLFRRK